MKKMVKSKGVMVSSIISLMLSLIVLATVSMAWLSMNKDTSSNGMQLKVEVTPNLIIDLSSSHIITVGGPTDTNFSVSFSDAAKAVKPATHNGALGANSWTYPSGLIYVSNPGLVDASTGLKKSGAVGDLTYLDADTGNPANNPYYKDFTVYIASSGVELTGQDLVARFYPAASISGEGDYQQDTLDASSIDFYVGTVSSSNYRGTLNVKGYDANANNHTTAKTEVTLLSNGTIPYNQARSGDKYITIIMRCYVDGALLKADNQAFINTEKVDLNDITLNVTFSASDHSNS